MQPISNEHPSYNLPSVITPPTASLVSSTSLNPHLPKTLPWLHRTNRLILFTLQIRPLQNLPLSPNSAPPGTHHGRVRTKYIEFPEDTSHSFTHRITTVVLLRSSLIAFEKDHFGMNTEMYTSTPFSECFRLRAIQVIVLNKQFSTEGRGVRRKVLMYALGCGQNNCTSTT